MRLIPVNENLWINAERITDIYRYNGIWKVQYDSEQRAEIRHDIGEFLQMLSGDKDPLIVHMMRSTEQMAQQQKELVKLLDAATQQIKEMQDIIALRDTELMALRHSMRLE